MPFPSWYQSGGSSWLKGASPLSNAAKKVTHCCVVENWNDECWTPSVSTNTIWAGSFSPKKQTDCINK